MYFRYVSPFFLGVVHHHARVASRQALGPVQGTCTSGTCPLSFSLSFSGYQDKLSTISYGFRRVISHISDDLMDIARRFR